MSDAQKLEAIIRQLGVAEIRMTRGSHLGLAVSLLFGVSTSRALRSWYWHPVWLELEGKNLDQMWATTDRGDWLLWFCTHMIGHPGWPTHQQIVLASCQCARLALKYINPGESRPLKAIETTEAWVRGEATLEQVKSAGHAAKCVTGCGDVVYWAVQAAHSAAWAVYATEDGHCFRFAQAASGTATDGARAAEYEVQRVAGDYSPATKAARDRVKEATLSQCADLVRQSLNIPKTLTTEFSALFPNERPMSVSLVNTIVTLFKKPATKPMEGDQRWIVGYKALERGKELYFQKDDQQALPFFDAAIDSGFEGANVFGMRGGCLQSLHFDLDAIDDFTKAIKFDPEDSNNYFMRSISKGAVGDLQGCIDDLKEAIRLASIDSASSRSHNAHARENGYTNGVADMYRMQIMSAQLDLERQASDEIRLQGPGASLGPDLVTERKSRANRRPSK